MQETLAHLRQAIAAAPDQARRVGAVLEAAMQIDGVDGCGLSRFEATGRHLLEMGHRGLPTSYSGGPCREPRPAIHEILVPVASGLSMAGALHVVSVSCPAFTGAAEQALMSIAQHALPLTRSSASLDTH
ncbi:MAG: hypothetical protein GY851_30270 [bacterium]|nr:hypothetical protein [bacterium]